MIACARSGFWGALTVAVLGTGARLWLLLQFSPGPFGALAGRDTDEVPTIELAEPAVPDKGPAGRQKLLVGKKRAAQISEIPPGRRDDFAAAGKKEGQQSPLYESSLSEAAASAAAAAQNKEELVVSSELDSRESDPVESAYQTPGAPVPEGYYCWRWQGCPDAPRIKTGVECIGWARPDGDESCPEKLYFGGNPDGARHCNAREAIEVCGKYVGGGCAMWTSDVELISASCKDLLRTAAGKTRKAPGWVPAKLQTDDLTCVMWSGCPGAVTEPKCEAIKKCGRVLTTI